jgi:outer membrane protein assembly factor BamB
MRNARMRTLLAATLAAIGLLSGSLVARVDQVAPVSDWPQFRGPQRDGISTETGLLPQWPASGPPQAWAVTGLGAGYGSVSMVGPRLFVQGQQGNQSVVHALDRAKGTKVWSRAIGPSANNDRGPGPRGTPTVDGDRLYALSETGVLACLRVADGTVVWTKNILREFGGRNIPWLISESPLVDGDRVIVTPGGRGAGMVALDKMTGATIWTSRELDDEAGYVSAVVADVAGVRTIFTITAENAVGVRASDGKLMWRYRPVANQTANISTPIVSGNRVFFTTGYGTGGALLTLTAQGGELRASETYFTRDMRNHHGGVVLVNGFVYGFDEAILAGMDFATGRRVWQHRSVGKGSVTYADNRLYIVGEDHVVGLAEVSPTGYRETGRFAIADKGLPSWAHPVVSGGRLHIRNQDSLTAYDVRVR